MGKRYFRKVIGRGRDLGPTEEEMRLFLDRQNEAEKPESAQTTENNDKAASPGAGQGGRDKEGECTVFQKACTTD